LINSSISFQATSFAHNHTANANATATDHNNNVNAWLIIFHHIPICSKPINQTNTMIAVFVIAGKIFEFEVDEIAFDAILAI